MKRSPWPVRCVVWLGLLVAATQAAAVVTIDYWNGVLPTGWQGGGTPGSGDSISIGNAVNQTVTLTGGLTVNTILFGPDGDEYRLDSATPITLGISTGFVATDSNFGRLVFEPNITVSLSGTPVFEAGSNSLVFYNKVTGTANPVFLSNSGQGSFLFVNSTGTNDYVGNTTIGDGNTAPFISFWNGSPFGTGTVTFLNGGGLIAHNTADITNNLVLNTAGTGNPLMLRSWDAPLTLSGGVTLANNTVINAQASPASYAFANGAGNVAVPGQPGRIPTVITGVITESGGSRSLSVQGQGVLILKPTAGPNTYTAGTAVNGALIFGNNDAIPTGTNNVVINGGGYVGIGDLSAGNFATQIAGHVNAASNGAVGVDTLPGNSTVTFADNINLTGFSNASIRFGTATSAILTGTFTPQGNNYQFGNGGGSLYVQSALGDLSTSQLQLNNSNPVPLKLYLQGTNTYTGGTISNSGFVIFDGPSALPGSGILQANGASSALGGSYVGYTDSAALTPAAFLARFNTAATWGVIGFDTHAGNSTATIGNVDLTGFNDGVYLGTATSADLTGTLTSPAGVLRLTAGNGGTLTVDSVLNSGSLVLGSPTPASPYFANGTVVLNGSNSYSGGTLLLPNTQGLTIGLGSNNAFGVGGVAIDSTNSGLVGLQAMSPGINIANNIAFTNYTAYSNFAVLHLLGSNSLELSGQLSGMAALQIQRPTASAAGDVTLSGNNSGLSGFINLQNSTVTLKHNLAAGQTNINFYDASATLAFGGAATTPVLYGISGDAGHLVLPNGTSLTFQMDDDQNHDGDFGGVISGAGGASTSASIEVDSSNNTSNQILYLHGHNLYTGGTSVTNYGVLALGAADSAGSGAVTLSATDGGLLLNTGVTFTNTLVFNSGGLAGLGAFAPASVSGTGQTAGKITIGANQFLFAGIPGDGNRIPGILTIQTDLVFQNGGSLREMIVDPAISNVLLGSPATNINGGYGLISVQGDLNLAALTTGGFTIAPQTVDANGEKGFSTLLVAGQSYHLPIVQATSITGTFDPANFTFDLANFQAGTMPASLFSLSADSTHLYLDFTPVPEPSTWALMVTGAGLLGFAARRRRQRH